MNVLLRTAYGAAALGRGSTNANLPRCDNGAGFRLFSPWRFQVERDGSGVREGEGVWFCRLLTQFVSGAATSVASWYCRYYSRPLTRHSLNAASCCCYSRRSLCSRRLSTVFPVLGPRLYSGTPVTALQAQLWPKQRRCHSGSAAIAVYVTAASAAITTASWCYRYYCRTVIARRQNRR